MHHVPGDFEKASTLMSLQHSEQSPQCRPGTIGTCSCLCFTVGRTPFSDGPRCLMCHLFNRMTMRSPYSHQRCIGTAIDDSLWPEGEVAESARTGFGG
jgi:hypothetical protein